MLTGDKQNTAIQIALSCNFISPGKLGSFLFLCYLRGDVLPICYLSCLVTITIMFISEPKGQLLLIDGKTEEDVSRSLERVLLTMRTTTSEPKVHPSLEFLHPYYHLYQRII